MLIPQVKAYHIESVHQFNGRNCALNEIESQFNNTDTIAYKVYHATLNPTPYKPWFRRSEYTIISQKQACWNCLGFDAGWQILWSDVDPAMFPQEGKAHHSEKIRLASI